MDSVCVCVYDRLALDAIQQDFGVRRQHEASRESSIVHPFWIGCDFDEINGGEWLATICVRVITNDSFLSILISVEIRQEWTIRACDWNSSLNWARSDLTWPAASVGR